MMFSTEITNFHLFGLLNRRARYSRVNQQMHNASIIKVPDMSRLFEPSLPPVVELPFWFVCWNEGNVSIQNKTTESKMMLTLSNAIALAAREVSGYSNNSQILHWSLFSGFSYFSSKPQYPSVAFHSASWPSWKNLSSLTKTFIGTVAGRIKMPRVW